MAMHNSYLVSPVNTADVLCEFFVICGDSVKLTASSRINERTARHTQLYIHIIRYNFTSSRLR